jgi:hypothetical protein
MLSLFALPHLVIGPSWLSFGPGCWLLLTLDECPSLAPLLRRRSPWWCQKIKCRVVFPPLPSFPFKGSSPWMALDDGTWARMCWRMSSSVQWKVVVSDHLGLACSSPLLVPILLHGVVLRWRAAVDRRSYEEWWRAQWPWCKRRVCCSVEAQINVLLASFSKGPGLSLSLFKCCFGSVVGGLLSSSSSLLC